MSAAIVIFCDGCGVRLLYEDRSQSSVRQEAKRNGWRRCKDRNSRVAYAMLDLCPKCVEKQGEPDAQ